MRMLDDLMPFLAMVTVQLGYAGMNFTSKLALDSGMKPLVLVAYRQMFATLATIPFAYFIEWYFFFFLKEIRQHFSRPFLCSCIIIVFNVILGMFSIFFPFLFAN